MSEGDTFCRNSPGATGTAQRGDSTANFAIPLVQHQSASHALMHPTPPSKLHVTPQPAHTSALRRRGTQGLLIVLLISATVSVAGCQPFNRPLPLRLTGQIRSVDAVQTQVEVGSTVYVQGTVGDRIPLVDGQVYALEDTTGYIWVVTSDATLTTGEEVLIQGTLSYQAIPEFGSDVGERYLWEVGQIERSP